MIAAWLPLVALAGSPDAGNLRGAMIDLFGPEPRKKVTRTADGLEITEFSSPDGGATGFGIRGSGPSPFGEPERGRMDGATAVPEVTGDIDPKKVQFLFKVSGIQLEACSDPIHRRNFTVDVSLDRAGITGVTVVSAIRDEKFEACAAARLKKWPLPRPKATETATIHVNLKIRPEK